MVVDVLDEFREHGERGSTQGIAVSGQVKAVPEPLPADVGVRLVAVRPAKPSADRAAEAGPRPRGA